ncbi:unnamed protein product, partial [Prorocentrum cordatum]
ARARLAKLTPGSMSHAELSAVVDACQAAEEVHIGVNKSFQVSDVSALLSNIAAITVTIDEEHIPHVTRWLMCRKMANHALAELR